jgi:hypothetical protein
MPILLKATSRKTEMGQHPFEDSPPPDIRRQYIVGMVYSCAGAVSGWDPAYSAYLNSMRHNPPERASIAAQKI